MGWAPVGVQCSLTSSLGDFLGNWAGSGNLGYCPCWCPSKFRFAFHLSVFPIPSRSSSRAIGFQSYFFFTAEVSASIRSTLHLLTWVSRLGTGSGTRCSGPRGAHRAEISIQISSWPGLDIGPWHLAAANVTTRLPRTPHFSHLLRHAGGYSGTILTPSPQRFLQRPQKRSRGNQLN